MLWGGGRFVLCDSAKEGKQAVFLRGVEQFYKKDNMNRAYFCLLSPFF